MGGPANRGLAIEKETLNEVRLSIQAGPEGQLLWTDTYYPGWSARPAPTAWRFSEPSRISRRFRIPSGSLTLVLRYQPALLRLGIKLAGAALMVMAIGSALAWLRPSKTMRLQAR